MSDALDIIIVGSGATGGWAAKLLTEAGLKVALLEAGKSTTSRAFSVDWNRIQNGPPQSATATRSPVQSSCYACRPPLDEWFVDDHQYPYISPEPFAWIRMRGVGGRMLGWEGQSYRLSDLDFKAASQDHYGHDWPINSVDLALHYRVAERYLTITGQPEHLVQLPDGELVDPTMKNVLVTRLRAPVYNDFRRTVTYARLSRVTRHNWQAKALTGKSSNPLDDDVVSPWTAIADAFTTGRLTLIANAAVTNVLHEHDRVSGVTYYDSRSMTKRDLHAPIVLLCASTLESTRILLNSALPNPNGVLGSYLMDHITGGGATATFDIPYSDSRNFHARNHAIYIPRFRNVASSCDTKLFIRGYAFQGTAELVDESRRTETYVSNIRRTCRIRVHLTAYGEALARPDNRVELDHERCDASTMPLLRIYSSWSDNERALMKDATMQAVDMLSKAGLAKVKPVTNISIPGLAIHEMGTARMGKNPESSVLDEHCETHAIDNLFVTDGACWVSSACQNPTLTMLALTGRACSTIIARTRFGTGKPSGRTISREREK